MSWLVTGGAGYIGAHVVAALDDAGVPVAVLDDLSTGRPERLPAHVRLVRAAVGDRAALDAALGAGVAGVVHLAARTSAPESVLDPLAYWRANVADVLVLLEAMAAHRVGRLVASSSAAVYGRAAEAGTAPLTEQDAPRPQSPYGTTKLAGEQLIVDAAAAGTLSAIALRYFNVVGAGAPELADPKGAGLLPRVLAARAGGPRLTVYGDRYPTPDGTAVRDFVHVRDVAEAHVAAVRRLSGPPCREVLNIGTGHGHSVLDLVHRVERVTGGPVPHRIGPARAGDPARAVADPARARALLGWSSRWTLDDAISSAWPAPAPAPDRAPAPRSGAPAAGG